MVTHIYKIRSEIWVASPRPDPPKKNLAAQKHQISAIFCTTSRIANTSGMQQDIVNRKMALQTTDTPGHANLIRCTLVHKRRKIGPEF